MSYPMEFVSADALLRAIRAQLILSNDAASNHIVAAFSIEERADAESASNWRVAIDLLDTPVDTLSAAEEAAAVVAKHYQLERRAFPRPWGAGGRHSARYAFRQRPAAR